jgi:hypothetical protein
MNVCSRIESSGRRGCIHASKETAEELKKHGKEGWLEKRQDIVTVKGKGTLETYWLNVTNVRQASIASAAPSDGDELGMGLKTKYGKDISGLDEKKNRLVNWNVEMLMRLLKQIVAHREVSPEPQKRVPHRSSSAPLDDHKPQLPLEEVREIIHLPEYDDQATGKQANPDKVEIPIEVTKQLHALVGEISKMYRNNPFHNVSVQITL